MDIRNNFPTTSELEKSIYLDWNSIRNDSFSYVARLAKFESPARYMKEDYSVSTCESVCEITYP